jgi:hypothetical protein
LVVSIREPFGSDSSVSDRPTPEKTSIIDVKRQEERNVISSRLLVEVSVFPRLCQYKESPPQKQQAIAGLIKRPHNQWTRGFYAKRANVIISSTILCRPFNRFELIQVLVIIPGKTDFS